MMGPLRFCPTMRASTGWGTLEKRWISVHLYGPRQGKLDGRDYDISCNYVCDRTEA